MAQADKNPATRDCLATDRVRGFYLLSIGAIITRPEGSARAFPVLNRGVSSRVLNSHYHDVSKAAWTACAAHIAGKAAQRGLRKIDGRGAYPQNAQARLSDKRPNKPTAVLLYDDNERLHCLAFDFDAKATNPEQARNDAYDAIMLLTEAGYSPVADYHPSGGWHVYAKLHRPEKHSRIASLAYAIEARYPSFDKSPLTNNPLHACIRPPGSPHARGGHQTLTTTSEAAQAALETDPGPAAFNRLRKYVNASAFNTKAAKQRRTTNTEWDLTRAKGTTKCPTISPHAEHLAKTGTCPPGRNCNHKPYKSPSEVRMAIVRSAVNNGWTYADLDAQLPVWRWLANALTGKASDILRRDWHNAKAMRAAERAKRPLHTDQDHEQVNHGHKAQSRPYKQHKPTRTNTRGVRPTLELGPEHDPYLQLRKFCALLEEAGKRLRLSPTDRAALRALTLLCLLQGRTASNAGLRSYAEAANLDHSTISNVLTKPELADLITRIAHPMQGTLSDVWELNIEAAAEHTPVTGKLDAVHPVFRAIGGHLEADVYQYLRAHRNAAHSGPSIAEALGYERQRVTESLQLLTGWNLAAYDPKSRKWDLGSANPDQLAERLGGYADQREQHLRHVEHRKAWARRLDREPQLANQNHWDDEFSAIEPADEQWVRDLASGSSPPSWAGVGELA